MDPTPRALEHLQKEEETQGHLYSKRPREDSEKASFASQGKRPWEKHPCENLDLEIPDSC